MRTLTLETRSANDAPQVIQLGLRFIASILACGTELNIPHLVLGLKLDRDLIARGIRMNAERLASRARERLVYGLRMNCDTLALGISFN